MTNNLDLVRRTVAELDDHDGSSYVTDFWHRLRWTWPEDLVGEVDGVRVASAKRSSIRLSVIPAA